MWKFLHRFGAEVIGELSGLDRIRFRGTQRLLATRQGMAQYLWQRKILWKDFASFAQSTTDTMRQAIEDQAKHNDRPVIYLNGSHLRKEDLALELAARDGISSGLIGVFKSVEPCISFTVRRNRQEKKLDLVCQPMKCLHYYHYYLDPRFGLMHVRTQSWFPFTVHICLNGREWLSKQMDAAGIGYVKKDNCFVDIADLPAAQALFDTQLRTDWPSLLAGLAAQSNPAHAELFASCPVPYYWSAEETEWASDVMFRTPESLAKLMPRLVRHGMEVLSCVDVLRFLGRREPAQCGTAGHFKGEVVTDLKRRPEGVRLLHRVNRNWIKMYDKQGTVLRVETVINDARDMKVFRSKEGDEDGAKKWMSLRKGVADLHRRTEISQKANDRYLDSLATAEETEPLSKLTERLTQPVEWKGRRSRALNPLGEADAALLAAVGRGEFLLNGFRNKDLRKLLDANTSESKTETRRQTSAVTRKIRLLRAHGVIQKVTGTQRYVVSENGRTTITALMAARKANAKLLAA